MTAATQCGKQTTQTCAVCSAQLVFIIRRIRRIQLTAYSQCDAHRRVNKAHGPDVQRRDRGSAPCSHCRGPTAAQPLGLQH